MQLNNYNQDSTTIYQQFANKSLLGSIEKSDKSTFEKNDMVEVSNNKNTQRDEESKKIENIVSSAQGLNSAKEEISKNGNLNKIFLQNLM